jgi:endonuclease-8
VPEGDTVWLAAKRLRHALAGRKLTLTDFRVPQLATTDLRGHAVADVRPKGKHLLTRIEGGLTLHTHFRMDGVWHIYRPGERWHGGPAYLVRAVLANDDYQAVGYRLPVVELLPTAEEDRVVGHLGPDLLDPHWGPELQAEAVRRVAAAPQRAIGEALLDQRHVAGIGNVYATELCFLAGVTPWLAVGETSGVTDLVNRAHALLDRNKEHVWQITTGDPRRGWSHWVYERTGQPCRRCGTPIRTAQLGTAPYVRVAYWCPRCQRGPAPQGTSGRQRRRH